MTLSDFDFALPPERIAQHPAIPRDAARLLEIDGDRLADRLVRELPGCLRPGDLLVSNDTRVIKAQLAGRRGAARVDVTLHKQRGPDLWDGFARPAKKLAVGDEVAFGPGFAARVSAKHDGGEVTLRFDRAGEALMAALAAHGRMPLPPYIKRPAAEAADERDYQTIFAAREGAVAAPTAGLHFTPALLAALDAAGVCRAQVTLHVGAGTFLPVKTENLADHRMHAEWAELPAATVAAIAETRARGGRVVAVGTTSLRTLEGVAAGQGALAPWAGELDLFIRPGFRFRVVDVLLTNFHLPRSTLFILVAAFAGLERMRRAYAHAIAAGYRFFSYGDACLIHRAEAA
ncbi:MAG: tRNA preQ1(34) S-adenosylmethionine ribosyltransferase-isomerase QueA [Alphaproteobacteria bacterium]|nr:tRNA preQ1(34) S-adenosylmethionine ribosyltransferase-isomerase QueA [Alphaproteobacteria bacterium]